MGKIPFVLVIQGGAGVGKSTLARKLAADLGLGVLSKDDIKESLFDTLLIDNREESRHLGVAVSRSLYEFIGQMIAAQKDIIVESVFNTSFANEEFKHLCAKYPARYMQIYCFADEETRQKRFMNRIENKSRHPRHFDTLEEYKRASGLAYDPLAIEPVVKIDTTNFSDNDYLLLLKQVKLEMEK